MENQKVKFEQVKQNSLSFRIGAGTLIKMFIRGTTDFSFIADIYKVMPQKAKGERVGFETSNGDRIIAVRTRNSVEVISSYNKHGGNNNVSSKIEAMIDMLFKMTLASSAREGEKFKNLCGLQNVMAVPVENATSSTISLCKREGVAA